MDPRVRPSRPRLGPVLRRSVPALVGVVVLAGLGLSALRVGQSSLRSAEDDRIESRRNLVAGYQTNAAIALDPTHRTAITSLPRLSPVAGPVNESLLKQIEADRAGDVSFVAVVTADGQVVQSVPSGVQLDVGLLGSAWTDALAGRSGLTDAFPRHDELITATVWPLGEGQPWGALVMGEALGRSRAQASYEQLGAQNGKPGGLFVTDGRGVVVEAAQPSLLGRVLLTPEQLRSIPADSSAMLQVERDGVETTMIVSPLIDGYVMGFEQATGDLLGDLRAAQHQRDLTLLGVLGATLGALVLFQFRRELTARRAEARVHALLRNGQDMIAVVGADGSLIFVSAAVEALLGYDEAVWLRRPLADLCHPDDVARLPGLLAKPSSGPLLNLRLRTAQGEYRWFDVEASDLRGHPEVGGILLTCHEIGDRKQLQDELSYQATHDRLTGLPNRAEMSEQLERLVADGRPARPFAVLYLDLDHFKPVNDALGHDAGDHVLVTVSERLRTAAGANGFVSRLGGDEFAILLDGAGEPEAVAVANDLLDAARAPIAVNATLVHLDASIGIALADPAQPLTNAEQLVRGADEAMYRAKKGGRGRFAFAAVPAPPADAATPVRSTALSEGSPGVPTDAGAGAPPPESGSSAARDPRRRRLRAIAPVLVAAGVVVAIAGAGFVQSTQGQRQAETERRHDMVSGLARAGVFYSGIYDPKGTATIAQNAPWALNGSALDQIVADAWTTNPQTGRFATAFLVTVDGSVLAASPRGATLGPVLDNPAWREAVAGRPAYLPWINDPDQPRSYYYLPIARDGRTAGVLLFGFSVRYGPGQEELQRAGSAGYQEGGFSLLDQDGVVYSSWNPDLIGTPLAERAELAAVPVGDARELVRPDRITVVAPMTATTVPTYIAFSAPTDSFYRDLRHGQAERDVSLLVLVLAAVAGLVTFNVRREQAVRRSERRLDSLLQNAHDVVVVLGADGRATFVSSAIQRLLQYEPADWLGRDLLDRVTPGDRRRLEGLLAGARERGTGSLADVRVRNASGEHRWFDVDAVDLTNHREVGGLLLTWHEVSERKLLQDQLAYRATRDPLTGLPNRAMLTRRLEELVEAPDAGPFAVLFVDLDHFKPVNDTFGHDAGDEVLRVISDRFRRAVRGEHDGPDGDLVCRLGGDEFAIILLNVTQAIAEATAARVVDVAREPVPLGDQLVQIGATVGVSVSHPHREDPDQAIRKADQAMYSAKEAGRNTFAVAPADR